MLPTNRMVANKKLGAIHGTAVFLAAGSFLVYGCRPPGPTALLQGERAIREGNLEVAVEQLQKATRLLPKNAQAWNHLGLAQSPNYGPALLNLAVVAQQNLYNRPLALQRYRQYLAIQPRPVNWESVAALANQLEAELNPPAAHPAHTNLVAAPVAKTNLAPIPANVTARNSTTAGAAVGGVPRASQSASATGSRSAPSSSPPNTNPILVASKASTP